MSDFSDNQNAPRKGMSLAEMAKAAAQKSASMRPPPAAPQWSGESFARPQSFRPPPPPIAPPSIRPAAAPSFRPAPPGSLASPDMGQFSRRPRNPPSLAPATRNLVDVYPAYRPKKRGAGTVLVGLFIAAAGVAGAYAIVTRQGVEPMDAIKRMIATLHPSEAAPANASFTLNHDGDPKPAAVMAGQPGSGPTTPRTTGVQISTLPPASAAAGTNAPGAIAKNTLPPPVVVAAKAPVAKPAEKQAAAPVEKTAAPVEKAAPPEPPPVAPPEPAGPPGLVGAIKKAAGPIEHAPVVKEPEPTPEKPVSNGEIPEAPAQGAIQGAIGAQRGAARACLDGQTTPSRATLVFGSNGKVQSVSVSGSAAGNGAETCIKRAMSRASVGPFSRPTFQVSVSISPP